MSVKSKTATFVHTLPLVVTLQDESILDKRFFAAVQLYNACLGESLKRLKLMRQSKHYTKAGRLKNKDKALRNQLYRKAAEQAGFSEYSLHDFVKKIRLSCWIQDHADSVTAQTVASRAFNAVKEYSFGKRGKPRFKNVQRFHSVEGKSNASPLKFRDGHIVWQGLKMPVIFDKKDTHGIEAHAMSCEIKYVRLLYRNLNGKRRWYAQLILAGSPKIKDRIQLKEGVVGLDHGPSVIAAVSEEKALLEPFCAELEKDFETKCRLQRKFARQLRLNNLDKFTESGVVKKNAGIWVVSGRAKKTKAELAEIDRIIADKRKQMHGSLANRLLEMGNHFMVENLNMKAWQRNKRLSRSVQFRAPGMFFEILSRKAVNAGGKVERFNPYSAKLSQSCICGAVQKKGLSERYHSCECGVNVQRDLFSAFLAMHIKNNNELDVHGALTQWHHASMDYVLAAAASSALEQSSGWSIVPASLGIQQGKRLSAANSAKYSSKVMDVVSQKAESRGELEVFVL